MTESPTNLIVRVILTPAPASRQAPVSTYRWDRILIVASLLIVVSMLAIKMMVPHSLPPTERTPSDTSDTALVDIGIPEADADSAWVPRNTQEVNPRLAATARSPAVTPAQTRVLSERVQRFVITNAIEAKESVRGVSDITQDRQIKGHVKVYADSQVHDLLGETLHYRWLYGNEVAADVQIKMHSNNVRSHSSKFLSEDMRGLWRVELMTSKGELLAVTEFEY